MSPKDAFMNSKEMLGWEVPYSQGIHRKKIRLIMLQISFASSICSLFLTLSVVFHQTAIAQSVVKVNGIVKSENNKALEGANIYFKNSTNGTSSDGNGRFSLTARIDLPSEIIVTMVGFNDYSIILKDSVVKNLEVFLTTGIIFGDEVVVSASRMEENILTSPVTIEKLNIIRIKELPSANFYDGLSTIKGLDMNVQSLTFKTPNTRGFNGSTNFRFNQIIDGVLNSAPGLSFAAGNLLGISEIDVESIELLTGASSALYGSGGMNGTLIIRSKNPFENRGISASLQTGLNNVNAGDNTDPSLYHDFNIRLAKTFGNKWALKLVGGYLSAEDWKGNDFRDKGAPDDAGSGRYTNPGYDGINIFGDEFSLNLKQVAPLAAAGLAETLGFTQGTAEYDSVFNAITDIIPDQKVTRTGWKEEDLVNYEAKNFKTSVDVSYKINKDLIATFQGGYATGQAVYTAQNRISLNEFWMVKLKSELTSGQNFVRYWYIKEDAGQSFDVGAAATLINEGWKSSEQWYGDYIAGYLQNKLLGGGELESHNFGRLLADNRDQNGNTQNVEKSALPLPGSNEFNTLFNDITRKPVNQGGSRVLDFSSMGQIEGLYNFNHFLNGLDLMIGFQFRHYTIDSNGTIFADTPDDPVKMNEWGLVAQYVDLFFDDKLKINLSARYDKNEFFKGQFTPRASVVYSTGAERRHNIRASIQSAFRFPAIADQWIDINVGGTQNVGGIRELQEKYQLFSNPVYPLVGVNPIVAVPDTTNGPFVIPAFQPEKVWALETGYKAVLLNNKLMVDASIYGNNYRDFHATQLLVQNPFSANENRYQTVISTDESVNTWGWSIGADYQFLRTFHAGGNLTFNTIDTSGDENEGFQSRFNTPEYRFNLNIGNRFLTKRIGFNINYRWQDSYIWESSFGVGKVASFSALDIQTTVRLPAISTSIKIGGANVLNHYYTTSLGSANVGGLYYIKLIYENGF